MTAVIAELNRIASALEEISRTLASPEMGKALRALARLEESAKESARIVAIAIREDD